MPIPQELIQQAKEKIGERAAFIIAEDLQLEQFDKDNLKSICPFHNEETGSFLWNSKDLCYHCFGACGLNYGLLDHYIKFNKLSFLDACEKLFKEADIEYRFGERGIKNSEYRYPHYVKSENRNSVEKYLGLRKISKETLDYADVQQDEHENIVFHYRDTNDVLTAVKYRPSHRVEKTDKMPKYWAQKDADNTAGTMYLADKANPTRPLLITEGEIDALSAIEAGWTNAVSIPFGAGKNKDEWIEKNYDWLEQFETIIVWFDNDEAGTVSRKDACARLGTWKTRFVNVPQTIEIDGKSVKIKDANEVLFYLGKDAVLDYIKNAEEVPVPNVTDLVDADDFDIESAPGLYTRLGGIDDIVYKLLYGSLVILTGKKGSGKSVFLNQVFVCEALEQGEDVFIYSGELGTSVLKNWIETPLIGPEKITMKNKFVRRFDEKAKKEMREWYKGRIWAYNDMNNDADQILDRAVSITRKFGTKVWILDNLMCLDLNVTGEDNQWVKQKEFVVKLVSLALTYGVLIVLVGHPRKTGGGKYEVIGRLTADDVAGSGDIGNMAHYILAAHRYTPQERKGTKNKKGDGYLEGREPIAEDAVIDILKNRYTGNLGEAKLFFHYESYRFYHSAKELWKRYGWNKDNSPLPTHMPKRTEDNPFDGGD